MNQVTIKFENGNWLVNDKQYHELSYPEKQFFDEFLIVKERFKKENPKSDE